MAQKTDAEIVLEARASNNKRDRLLLMQLDTTRQVRRLVRFAIRQRYGMTQDQLDDRLASDNIDELGELENPL